MAVQNRGDENAKDQRCTGETSGRKAVEEEMAIAAKDSRQLLQIVSALSILDENRQDFTKFLTQIRNQYELDLTDCLGVEGSVWDSFFTAIFQHVFQRYKYHDIEQLVSFAGAGSRSSASAIEVKLSQIKRKSGGDDSLTTAGAIADAFSNKNSAIVPHICSLLALIKKRFGIQVNLHLFRLQPVSVTKFEWGDDIAIDCHSYNVVLMQDPSLNIFRSFVLRQRFYGSDFDEYCVQLMASCVENQELLSPLEHEFSKLESTQFQEWTTQHLRETESVKSVKEFCEKLMASLSLAGGLTKDSNIHLIAKYESKLRAEVAKELLETIKTQFLYSLTSASEFILERRVAEHREKVRQLLEKEEELILEDDRLEQVIDQAGKDKEKCEEELRALEIELKKSKADKERLEKLIAVKKAELERSREDFARATEKFEWNSLKKQLMEISASYENLKKGAQFLRRIQSADQHLVDIVRAILQRFPLHLNQENLIGFAQRSENNTAENRQKCVDIVHFILEPPKIMPKIGSDDVLEVTGRQIVLSEIVEEVKAMRFREIRIAAGNILYVDGNMEQETFHGKNIVLVAPTLHVVQNSVINTSGVHGEPKLAPPKAESGQSSGRNGTDGLHGDAGETGGHVYIQTPKIVNVDKLRIIASGGNGGQGQNGGDGRAGEDGWNGEDGFVEDQSYWTSSVCYQISRGRSGRVGQRGGNGGNPGLGGEAGRKGQVQLTGHPTTNSIVIIAEDGVAGTDGRPGAGARGGTGGTDGVDMGVAWHNYAFASGEFRMARGKLGLRKQNVWYGGNGWELLVLRTVDEVRSRRSSDGEHGKTGSKNENQRKTAATSKKISETEVAALAHTIHSQYIHSDMASVENALNVLSNTRQVLEEQQSSLNAEKAHAEETKDQVEQHIKITKAAIKAAQEEKARLEQLIATSLTEREAVQKEMAQVKVQKQEIAKSVAGVAAAEQAGQAVQQVVQAQLKKQTDLKIAESIRAQNQVKLVGELDISKTKAKTDMGRAPYDVSFENMSEEEFKVAILYDEVRLVKNIDKLSDEFFAIALASRVKDKQLANAFEIGLQSVKQASDNGAKLPGFVREFLLTQSKQLVQQASSAVTKDNGDGGQPPEVELPSAEFNQSKKFILTPTYLREKLPVDTEVVQKVQGWVDRYEKKATKIFQLVKYNGSSVGEFIVKFRHDAKFRDPKKIGQAKMSVSKLKKVWAPDNDASGTLLHHLELILVDHMESWFLNQCKIRKFSDSIMDKVNILVKLVDDIYREVVELKSDTSLEFVYSTFLEHVENPDFGKTDDDTIWQGFVLEITGVVRKRSFRDAKSLEKCLNQQFDSLEATLHKLQRNKQQVYLGQEKNTNKNKASEAEKQLNILSYVFQYIKSLSTAQLQLLYNRSRVASMLIWPNNQFLFNRTLNLQAQIVDNYLENHQRQQSTIIQSYLTKIFEPKTRTQLVRQVERLTSLLESDLSECPFELRLSHYKQIHEEIRAKSEESKSKSEELTGGEILVNKIQSFVTTTCANILRVPDSFQEKLERFNATVNKLLKIPSFGSGKASGPQQQRHGAIANDEASINSILNVIKELRTLGECFLGQELNREEIFELNDSIIDFCRRSTEYRFNSIVIDTLMTLQLNLQRNWFTVLRDEADNLLLQRKREFTEWDELINGIMKLITEVTDSSTEILMKQELQICIKMHLIKLVDGLDDPKPCLKRILELTTSRIHTRPKEFVQHIACIVNEETAAIRYECDIQVHQQLKMQAAIARFNEDANKLPRFIELVNVTVQAIPAQQNQQEFDELARVLDYLIFVASHHHPLQYDAFDACAGNAAPSPTAGKGSQVEDNDERHLHKALAAIHEMLTTKTTAGDHELPDDVITNLKRLETLLAARLEHDFLTFLSILQNGRQKRETEFEDKLVSILGRMAEIMADVFEVYEGAAGDVATYASPIRHLMETFHLEILPNFANLSQDELQDKLNRIYFDSFAKYFNLHSIPVLPTVIRAAIIHFGRQVASSSNSNNEANHEIEASKVSGQELVKVFDAFQNCLKTADDGNNAVNKGWEFPFLTILTKFLGTTAQVVATCEQIEVLVSDVRKLRTEYQETTRKEGETETAHFGGKMVYKLYDLEEELTTLAHNSLLDRISQLPSQSQTDWVKNLSKLDQVARIIYSPNADEARLFQCELYTLIECLAYDGRADYEQTVLGFCARKFTPAFIGGHDGDSDNLALWPSKYLKYLLDSESEPENVLKWSLILGVLIFTWKLNDSETAFCDRIASEDVVIGWNPTETQKTIMTKLIEAMGQATDTEISGNRLISIVITDLCIENKSLLLSFLTPSEQFYLSSIVRLISVEEHSPVLQFVTNLMTNQSPSEWLFHLREQTLNTMFSRLLSLYLEPGFEESLNKAHLDVGLKLVAQITAEMNIYRAAHHENRLSVDSLQLLAEKYDSLHPPTVASSTGQLRTLKQMIDDLLLFKHYYNRHFYFATENLRTESQLLTWLDMLYQRCTLRKLDFGTFNDLLLRSTELSYEQLIQIANETTFDNWMQSMLVQIILKYYSAFVDKITRKTTAASSTGCHDSDSGSSGGQADFEKDTETFEPRCEQSSVEAQLLKTINKSGEPSAMKNKLLGILADKLYEEVEFASDSSSIEAGDLQAVFNEISAWDETQVKFTAESIKELKRLPLSRWPFKFYEFKLLQKHGRTVADAILKFQDRFGRGPISNGLLDLILPFRDRGDGDRGPDSEKWCKFLDNFSQCRWELDEILLKNLLELQTQMRLNGGRGRPTLEGLGVLCDKYAQEMKDKKRDAAELIRLMREDSKNSAIQPILDVRPPPVPPQGKMDSGGAGPGVTAALPVKCKLEIQFEAIQEALKSPSKVVGGADTAVAIREWSRAEIDAWTAAITAGSKNERRTRVKDHQLEVVAVISQGLKHLRGFYPRETQVLSVLVLLNRSFQQKGCLAEISTGEGKTFIVGILVIIRALCGDDVDVITSSPVLAVENVDEIHYFLALFGIQATNNCDKACEQDERVRKERYKSQVIYGDVGSFQRDILLSTFFEKGITMNRTADTIFVDEVDSMLLDKGENILYLSHSVQELKFLWPIFIEIWQAVHAPDACQGRNQDVFLIVRFIKERIRRGDLFFPNCLQDFIEQRLTVWVQNAYLAKRLNENDPYILTDVNNKGPSIVIVDKDTGVEQVNMNWSNGLHQFIQLKHTDKLGSESLKAVFMSNISYFRGYKGRLFGITGTLGSRAERELLAQCYHIDFFAVPRFKGRRCYEERGLVCGTQTQWLNEIGLAVGQQVSQERPRAVLLICENVETVDRISKELHGPGRAVYVYKSSFDTEFKSRRETAPLTNGDIIVATNIAGRGTDLKTSKTLEAAGGLHVILTYMPGNIRIEEQAFGRTARAGLSGTVQYILLDDSTSSSSGAGQLDNPNPESVRTVEELRRLRDDNEGQRLDNFRIKSIPRIELEEKLCQKFKILLQTVKEILISKKQGDDKAEEELIEIHLDNLKNRWAIWLDSMGERIKLAHITKEDAIFEHFQGFQDEMLGKARRSKNDIGFETGPIEMTRLGRHFEGEENYPAAEGYFDKAIAKEPLYSEVAHYYKASCILRQSDSAVWDKRRAIKHLKLADHLIRKRIQQLLASSQTLELTDNLRREAGEGSMSNRFEKQVSNEAELLQCHIGKIEEAIGSTMDPKFFAGVKGVLEEAEGEGIFNVLRRHGRILKNYRLSKKVRVDSCQQEISVNKPVELGSAHSKQKLEWPNTYLYCKKDVLEYLAGKLNRNDRASRVLEESAFEQFILTQDKLWHLLKQNKYVENEESKQIDMVCLENEKAFEAAAIEFPADLVDYKTSVARILQCNHQQPYDPDIFDELELPTPDLLEKLEQLLQKSKILQSKVVCRAAVSEVAKRDLKWNPVQQKWTVALVPELQRYQDIVQVLLNGTDEHGEPTLVENVVRDDIPLPTSTLAGSKEIWAFLSSSGAIKTCRIDFSLSNAESSTAIKARLDEIRTALTKSDELAGIFKKYHPKQDGAAAKTFIDDIMSAMEGGIGKIKSFPAIEVNYTELSEYYQKGAYPPEIEEFRDMVFFQLLECTEKKSWWDWGAFIVAMLGVAQIIAGVLLEVFTAGAATHFAMALISEGIGDIAFAIQAGLSKNFAWKDYAVHKAISVTISIATAGVGAWLSRGAQVAKYGTQVGFQLFKAVGKTVLKKCLQVAAYTLADIGVDKLLEKIRQEVLKSCGDTMASSIEALPAMQEKYSKLSAAMQDIYENSYENGQAEKVIRDTFDHVLNESRSGNIGTTLHRHGSTLASSLAAQMGESGSKLFSHAGDAAGKMNFGGASASHNKAAQIVKIAKIIGKLVKAGQYLKVIMEMVQYAPELLDRLNRKLKVEAVTLKNHRKDKVIHRSSPEKFSKFKTEFMASTKTNIVSYMLESVQYGFVSPAIQSLIQTTLRKIGKCVAASTKSVLQSLRTDQSVKTLGEYQLQRKNELTANEIQQMTKGGQLSVENLDPDMPIANLKDTTVGDVQKLYGDSANLYQDKKGQIHCERPKFEHFVSSLGNGKTSGYMELLVCANYYESEIVIQDMTGELQSTRPDGIIAIQPKKTLGRLIGLKKKGPPLELVYTKTDDGVGHFTPKINGKLVDLPQSSELKNTCLYQSLDFLKKVQSADRPTIVINDQWDSIIQSVSKDESVRKSIERVQKYARGSERTRIFYNEGVNELAARFSAGMPAERVNFTAEEVQKFLFSQSSVRGETSDKIPIESLMEQMKTAANWDVTKNPIDVVEMKRGQFVSLDNRRLVAAMTAGIGVQANVYQPDEPIPNPGRFGDAKSAGDANLNRIGLGSEDESYKRLIIGYPVERVRIRTDLNQGLQPFHERGFIVSRVPRKRARRNQQRQKMAQLREE